MSIKNTVDDKSTHVMTSEQKEETLTPLIPDLSQSLTPSLPQPLTLPHPLPHPLPLPPSLPPSLPLPGTGVLGASFLPTQ